MSDINDLSRSHTRYERSKAKTYRLSYRNPFAIIDHVLENTMQTPLLPPPISKSGDLFIVPKDAQG